MVGFLPFSDTFSTWLVQHYTNKKKRPYKAKQIDEAKR